MKLTTILFDLDGTLLPMDQDIFVKDYMMRLAVKAPELGCGCRELTDAIIAGIGAMIKNDGGTTNEEMFWNRFNAVLGKDMLSRKPVLDAFYQNEFQLVRDSCGFDARAAKLIEGLKEKGYRLLLATNPLFPQMATHSRVRWAGLNTADFDWITTYENACFCKPNLKYYEEIVEKLELEPAECLMVGNDVDEDMIAARLGMKVFLLTDCLINRSQREISAYPNGSFEALEAFVLALEMD